MDDPRAPLPVTTTLALTDDANAALVGVRRLAIGAGGAYALLGAVRLPFDILALRPGPGLTSSDAWGAAYDLCSSLLLIAAGLTVAASGVARRRCWRARSRRMMVAAILVVVDLVAQAVVSVIFDLMDTGWGKADVWQWAQLFTRDAVLALPAAAVLCLARDAAVRGLMARADGAGR